MDSETARAVLGLNGDIDEPRVRAAFKTAAKRHHPDAGGDRDEFVRAKEARDCLLAHLSHTGARVRWATAYEQAAKGRDDLSDRFRQARERERTDPSPSYGWDGGGVFAEWARNEADKTRTTDEFAKMRAQAREARRRKPTLDDPWAQMVAVRLSSAITLLNIPAGCSLAVNDNGTIGLFLHSGTDRESRVFVNTNGAITQTMRDGKPIS